MRPSDARSTTEKEVGGQGRGTGEGDRKGDRGGEREGGQGRGIVEHPAQELMWPFAYTD